jgi:uncharacterized protein DUF4436
VTRRWKPSHRQTIALVVTGVLVVAGVAAYASYRGYTTSVAHKGFSDLKRNVGSDIARHDARTPDTVYILASVEGVSPESRTVEVRLHFAFYRHDDDQPSELSKPAKVIVLGGVADRDQEQDPTLNEYSLGVDQPFPNIDVTADVADDTAPKYPFDSYQSAISVKVEYVDGEPLRAVMFEENEANGWMVSPTNDPGEAKATIGYSFEIHRTTDSKFYAIFIVALMWLLALAGVVMAVILIGRKDQEVGPDHLVYLAALLFAFPLMRTLLPGNPPLGILADFAGYFWAEVIVGITLLALLVTWIVRTRRTHEEIDLREASVPREEPATDLVDVH